jgi:aminoglycoside/choline kinase family phosphotransferase
LPIDETSAPLIAAAQPVLATTLGAQVTLTQPVRLTDDDRRNALFRCTVIGAPSGQPATIIIKQVVAEQFDPDDVDSWDTQRFFRDWNGAAFLSAISAQAAHAPRFYGGDAARGFFVLEDLGENVGIVDWLLGADPARAEEALLQFAERLGQMHATTIGAADRFEQLTRTTHPRHAVDVRAACRKQALDLQAQAQQLFVLFDRIGVPIAKGAAEDVASICATIEQPGDFLAYVHGDPCPDNIFYAGGRLQLIDFEFGHFGHALRDGAYGRMCFPTCWCANQIPAAVVERMEQRYRAELMTACPAARDDAAFATALVQMCGFWVIGILGWHLERAIEEDDLWGIATVRERLKGRLRSFIDTATSHRQLPALAATAEALLEYVNTRWVDVQPLALYPAFRE